MLTCLQDTVSHQDIVLHQLEDIWIESNMYLEYFCGKTNMSLFYLKWGKS